MARRLSIADRWESKCSRCFPARRSLGFHGDHAPGGPGGPKINWDIQTRNPYPPTTPTATTGQMKAAMMANTINSARRLLDQRMARAERYLVGSEVDTELERHLFDHPVECGQLLVLDNQTEAEIGGWHAGGAATGAGVPDEIGHIGPV